MTRREQQLHLNNISSGISSIQQDVSGISEEEFSREEQVKEAVYTKLQMIGEAAHELAQHAPEAGDLNFPTDTLASFRHARYNNEMEINHQQVWSIIRNDLEEIRMKSLRYSAELEEIDSQ